MKKLTTQRFQKIILNWYAEHGRHDLPWRKTRDPYAILVSEIMLQQTQISRVLLKYQSFLKEFPTLDILAKAPQKQVLAFWQGLGYNRRALYLQKTAKEIRLLHSGRFPKSVLHLESLPGIGPYTARAVAVFSWKQPHVLLETNIRRVMLHFFFQKNGAVADSEIMPVLERVLYSADPRLWYWALMDYGAGPLKKIPNPNQRSKAYTKQSRFEGSRRFVRAKIVSFLLEKDRGATLETIIQFAQNNPHVGNYGKELEIRKIVSLLETEDFLIKKGRKWFIK